MSTRRSPRPAHVDVTRALRLHERWLAGARVNARRAGSDATVFTGADLAGVDLSRADLDGHDLRGTDLAGANLGRRACAARTCAGRGSTART